MATLKSRLAEFLGGDQSPLPSDPSKAISGTELLGRVRDRFGDDYADASIRQTFSILASESTSPIARKQGGIGYYMRTSADAGADSDASPVASSRTVEPSSSELDVGTCETVGPTAACQSPAGTFVSEGPRELVSQPEEKFRAFFIRHARLENRFPFKIDHLVAKKRPRGVNKWKFPDAVVLDWDVVEEVEDGALLVDRDLLEVKRSLGEQPFTLTSVELKVDLTLGTFREFFFQCVSNSRWAHRSNLIVAHDVSDRLLVDELVRLGTSYDITVQSYGFSDEKLASLEDADRLEELDDEEFEKLVTELNISPATIVAGPSKPDLDWEHLRDLRAQTNDFQFLFGWAARCLRDGRAYTVTKYKDLIDIENCPS